MRPIPANVSPFRGLCVCLCAGHSLKLCDNLCTDRDCLEQIRVGQGARDGGNGGTHWRHLANTLDRSVRRRRYSLVGVNGTKIGLPKPEKCLQTVDCQEKNFFSCIKIFCKLFKHMVSNLLPRRDNATISWYQLLCSCSQNHIWKGLQ